MKDSTVIDLPLPPHPCHLDTPDSAEFRSWLDAAGRKVIASAPSAVRGHVSIRILAGIPSEPSELGYVAPPIIDLLEIHEVITKAAVSDLALRFDRTIPAGVVRVEFRHVRAPHVRSSTVAREHIAKAQRARWIRERAAKAAAAEGRHSDV